MRRILFTALPVILFIVLQQNPTFAASDLTLGVSHTGIGLGNSRNFTGIRFNLRDNGVESIRGINITLWSPVNTNRARITGLSFGLVAPGANRLSGIQIGGIGVAGGESVTGINIAGIGVGADGNITGITFGGIGAGSGGNISGILIGGLGAGCQGNISGIALGGLGVGANGNLNGIFLGGLGAGTGGSVNGVVIGGLGAGAGENINGIAIGGLGAGCGGSLNGFAAGLIGAGAPNIQGLTIAGVGVDATNFRGINLTTGMLKIRKEGRFTGFSLAGFNRIWGHQTGLTIGLINYAESADGIQIGLINIIKENTGIFKYLPVINFNL